MKRLFAVFVATIAVALMTVAPAAAATGIWQGNGYPSASCKADTTGTALWIWTGDSPTALTINGQVQSGLVGPPGQRLVPLRHYHRGRQLATDNHRNIRHVHR